MANEMMNRRHELFDQMNDWFGFPKDFFDNETLNIMQSDVAETDKAYLVKIDMPGMQKDKIHVAYNNGLLNISGSRETVKDHNDKAGNLIHQERSEGRISRSYRLPDADVSQIKAQYSNGVLSVTLPKQTTNENGNIIPID